MPKDPEDAFWRIALSRLVVRRAARVALVVGTVLAAINHGDRLLSANLDPALFAKILISFCVPYTVSTYSSFLALRDHRQAVD
jgi:hypothetical protein